MLLCIFDCFEEILILVCMVVVVVLIFVVVVYCFLLIVLVDFVGFVCVYEMLWLQDMVWLIFRFINLFKLIWV